MGCIAATQLLAVIALALAKKWINAHEARTQGQLNDMAELRRQLDEDHGRRLLEIQAREERLNRFSDAHNSQLVSLAQRLDEALAGQQTERHLRAVLQTEFDQLAAEHNALIMEVLRERAAAFTRSNGRPSSSSTSGSAGSPTPHGPARLRTPLTAIPQPHNEHTHAGEGVGDAGYPLPQPPHASPAEGPGNCRGLPRSPRPIRPSTPALLPSRFLKTG
ncbi:hypothetical protein [Streptomyces sp. H27-S2]|uniref:hypothetical protein n=1 Tax=Streptomyces antarcticus TaxID=2996458 RepID=UPI00226DFE8E|nr:hypothetical protein [Streptomyces sp. H27-S2]MCY0947999.1 hypothetical protein [Streptomyces sp. H27-S2]